MLTLGRSSGILHGEGARRGEEAGVWVEGLGVGGGACATPPDTPEMRIAGGSAPRMIAAEWGRARGRRGASVRRRATRNRTGRRETDGVRPQRGCYDEGNTY